MGISGYGCRTEIQVICIRNRKSGIQIQILDINRNYVIQPHAVTQVIIIIQKRHSKTSIFALTKKVDIAIIFLKQKAL